MKKQRSTFVVKRILLFFFLLAYSCANESKNTSYGSAEHKTLAEFKITKNGGPILLPITFIDKELLFLLDTGSSYTVFDASLKHELGEVKKIEKALTHGSPIKTEIYDAPQAFLGPLNLQDSGQVSCLDLKMLSLIDGKTISGIIGMNFLKRHIIQIDFDQGTFSFLQPVEDQHPDWGIELLLKYDTPGWPYITGEILESINANFVIDTGSNSTGALGSEIFDQILSEKELKTSKTLFATASGVIQNRECRIDSLSIGSFEYKELIFSEANWSCLGLLFLSRHTVTFDFPSSRIYLKRGKQFKKEDETDMSGLHLLRIANQTVVYSVDENSPAQKTGIVPKDIILKVNEKDAGKYDMWELRRLLMSEDKKKITMTIKQGENVKDVAFQLEKKI
jgi:predicted aspartyl protease